MRAIIREWYGPPEEVLELRDVEMPTIGDGEVLVRVRAASVNAGDPPIVKGSPYVIRRVRREEAEAAGHRSGSRRHGGTGGRQGQSVQPG